MSPTHRYELPCSGGDDAELVAARLWQAGALGVWERDDRVVAWFPGRSDDVPADGAWALEPDRDWQAEWKATVRPVRAGAVVVVPTWLADEHGGAAEDVVIVLDPGRAFGSGHHATTLECLDLLQTVAVAGRSVLDVGTGTGVLAIAAAKLGARVVVATDTDPDAVAVARENARHNEVTLDLRDGSIAATDREFDIVLANLTTHTLVALNHELARATAPGGSVIASGIADERADLVVAAFARGGLALDDRRSRDGWTALRAARAGAGR